MPTTKYYNEAGKRLQSFSTKAKNIGWGHYNLMRWANAQGLEGNSLDEAKATVTMPGTIAHLLVECDLKGTKADLSRYDQEDIEKAHVSYSNYILWKQQWKIKPIFVEEPMVSERFQYGGCPDLFAHCTLGNGLFDWKTGRRYASIFVQLAAYGNLIEEVKGFNVNGGFHCLRIPKDEDVPGFHHDWWETLPDEAWEAWECAVRLGEIEKKLNGLL